MLGYTTGQHFLGRAVAKRWNFDQTRLVMLMRYVIDIPAVAVASGVYNEDSLSHDCSYRKTSPIDQRVYSRRLLQTQGFFFFQLLSYC